MKVKRESEVAQLCLTLCDPMDCSLPGSSVHDFPGNSTGVDCHLLLQGIFPTQGSNPGLPHRRQTCYRLSHQGTTGSEAQAIDFDQNKTALTRVQLFKDFRGTGPWHLLPWVSARNQGEVGGRGPGPRPGCGLMALVRTARMEG